MCMSCPHEGEMRYIHIPKLTLCYISMEPLLIVEYLCKFCSDKMHKAIMQLCTIASLPPGINETMYYLNDHRYYLESIAEITKVSSSIEHQSAETYT